MMRDRNFVKRALSEMSDEKIFCLGCFYTALRMKEHTYL